MTDFLQNPYPNFAWLLAHFPGDFPIYPMVISLSDLTIAFSVVKFLKKIFNVLLWCSLGISYKILFDMPSSFLAGFSSYFLKTFWWISQPMPIILDFLGRILQTFFLDPIFHTRILDEIFFISYALQSLLGISGCFHLI